MLFIAIQGSGWLCILIIAHWQYWMQSSNTAYIFIILIAIQGSAWLIMYFKLLVMTVFDGNEVSDTTYIFVMLFIATQGKAWKYFTLWVIDTTKYFSIWDRLPFLML